MLVARLEIWPGGNQHKARHLGTLRISNMGGDGDVFDYAVELDVEEHEEMHVTSVRGWVGLRDAWALVHEALTKLGVMGWRMVSP